MEYSRMETTVQLKVEKQADGNCKMEKYMTEVQENGTTT
jgi:hypothetical protein